MQPTFLPWLGYLDLWDQVDRMIWLDDVPFSRQSWQQRNRVRTAQGAHWLTVPVQTRGRSGQLLRDVEIATPGFWRKALRTLEQSYAGCTGAAEVLAQLEAVWACEHERLVALNLDTIAFLQAGFSIETPSVRASELGAEGRRGEHVAALCEVVGATEYLTPPGAVAYLREERAAFRQRGVEVAVQRYEHPRYAQSQGAFVSHLSALDAWLQVGCGAAALMRSGRREARALEEVAA